MKKYLVDTCGWIEWLTNGSLATKFEPYLKKVNHLIMPTLIQHELYKWICREKNQNIAFEVIGITEKATVVPLDTHIALDSADIAKQYRLAMADAVIYATAQKYAVEVITCDEHFANLPGIKYLTKKNNKA